VNFSMRFAQIFTKSEICLDRQVLRHPCTCQSRTTWWFPLLS
jgi:hypothetical protein